MIACPKCNATLPDGFASCHFCGAALSGGPPPVRLPSGRGRPASRSAQVQPGAPSWVLPAYNGVALWWVISGSASILESVVSKSGGNVIVIVLGALTALIGLGLLLRVNAVRGVVNVLCFLNILGGAFGLLTGFVLTGVLGFWGAFMMLRSPFDIALAVLMIYLIGETDP